MNIKNTTQICFAFLLSLTLLQGCAIGNKYDYQIESMPLPVSGNAHVGLLVVDQRPYILDGDKNADFVGLQRGGFGNPFDVTTASGQPLADDMALSLKNALEANGFSVTLLKGKDSDPEVVARMARINGLKRVIVVDVKEWKSDVYAQLTFHYDLKLLIFDSSGQVIAENEIRNLEGKGMGGGITQAKHSALVRSLFERKMGYLFNPPEVRKALTD